MIIGRSLEGKQKKRGGRRSTTSPSDPRQSSSSGSSGQINDGLTRQRVNGHRAADHIFAQSELNMSVSSSRSSSQPRSASMDQVMQFAQKSSNSPLQTCLPSFHYSYPQQRISTSQGNINQSYFDDKSSPPDISGQGFSQNTEHQYPNGMSTQSHNRTSHPAMTTPQWNAPRQNRAREDSAVSPLATGETGFRDLYESQDAQLSWDYQQHAEASLRNEGIGTDSWGRPVGVDNDNSGHRYEVSVSADKVAGESTVLQVDGEDYRHPTSTTESAYEDSVRSSSRSSRANSTAGSRTDTYFSSLDEQADMFPSAMVSRAGSQHWGHSAQPTHYEGGLSSRSQESRGARSRNTAFQRQVDIWKDGHRSYYAPSELNNRTLLLDTQCRESNWVSRSIINHLDLRGKTRQLSQPLHFACANGGNMTATEVITLTFREQEGVARTTEFFVASEEVPFEILLGADDIENFMMLVSNPPVARFFGLIPRTQT